MVQDSDTRVRQAYYKKIILQANMPDKSKFIDKRSRKKLGDDGPIYYLDGEDGFPIVSPSPGSPT